MDYEPEWFKPGVFYAEVHRAAAEPVLAPRWWCHCFLRDESGECDCEPGEAPWLRDPKEVRP